MKDMFKDYGICFILVGFIAHVAINVNPHINMLKYGITLNNLADFIELSIFSFLTFLALMGTFIYWMILFFNDKEEENAAKMQKNFCNKCGNKLETGSKFCSHCGTKVKYKKGEKQ